MPDAGGGCKSSADCDYNAPVCQAETGKCFKCLSDLSCPPGLHCVDNECICTTPADCRYALETTCDATTRQCLVGCDTVGECNSVFGTYCEMTRGVCIQCSSDTECKGKTFGSASTERCHNAVCVQCVQDSDCPDPKSHCQTRDGVCLDCLKTDHCPDNTTCFDGHCIPTPPVPASP